MATEGRLEQPYQNSGAPAQVTDTVSLADGGTFDTGLETIEEAWAESTVDNAGTTLHKASVSTTSGGTVTIALANLDGTAGGAAVTTAEDVKIIAVGEA